MTILQTGLLMGLIVALVCLAGVVTGYRAETRARKNKIDTWA